MILNPFHKKQTPTTTNPSGNTSVSLSPITPQTHLPELKVIAYTTEAPEIEKKLLEECGISIQQTTFTDVDEFQLDSLMDDFDLNQMQLDNSETAIEPELVFDTTDLRKMKRMPLRTAYYTALLKAKDGKQRDMAYSSTTISDTRIQAGGLDKPKENKGLKALVLGK